jgi:F-type H+-transporting ATPase subunit b
MGLITPDYGLLVWMLISFGIVIWLLKKFAWKPILQGLKHREEQIAKSLREANSARNEMVKLHEQNAEMANLARQERDAIMLEAKVFRERMVKEATDKAQVDAKKFLEQARLTIIHEKEVAQTELKAYASTLAIQMAEIILRKELSNKQGYEEQIRCIINEMTTKN